MINISVIIPTCNRNDLLSICLDRLDPQNQLNGDFTYEVIVTDDGKEKGASDMIKEKHSWAIWTKGPTEGPAANRNNGAKMAQGEWLVFLDDDCLPDLDLLANYYKAITEDRDVKVIEGLIYSDEKIPALFIAPVNLHGGRLWSCNFAINKGLYNEVKGFDQNYKYPNMEDNDLCKRLTLSGEKMIFNKNAKVYHPPRPMASPKKLAIYHESWIYYYSKFGPKKTVRNLLVTICRNRLVSILKAPKSMRSVTAVFALLAELYYTIIISRKWTIK